MPRFPVHDLSDTEFEQLVVLICRELMGIGITSFAPGPDGGKDAKFEGTAAAFPSTTAPASGKFIVQAKHASSSVASCSDYDFETTCIDKEIPKIQRMFQEGSLTHYLIFLPTIHFLYLVGRVDYHPQTDSFKYLQPRKGDAA